MAIDGKARARWRGAGGAAVPRVEGLGRSDERRQRRCRRAGSANARSRRSGSAACRCRSRGGPDRERSIATIHAALDAGITFIDTADAYHLHADEVGHNESLIAEALASYGGDTSDVLVATKGGHLRPGDGSWTLDGSPEYIKQACEASLKRLGVDAIGLYQFHRPDPKVPYEESVGAIRDLLDEGKIRMAGISNANPEQIRQAQEILGGRLVSVQNQFSPAFRSSGPSSSCATSWASPSCPGARSAASARPAVSATGYAPFQQVARRPRREPAAGHAWPGCSRCRRSSSRSPGRAGPRRSATRPRPPTSSCPKEELALLG